MNRKELMSVVKELNQDEELLAEIGEKKIRVVGVKTEELIENFGRVMLKLDDAGLTDEISEDVIDFFEANVDKFMPEETEEEEVVEEKKVEKEDEGREEVYKGDKVKKEGAKEEAEQEIGKTKKDNSKKATKGVVMDFLAKGVAEGKYTRIEIIEKALEQFPDKSKNYFGTYLSDGKNPKYCKFDSLIIVDEEGVLSFEE